jgi:hypothetical protein
MAEQSKPARLVRCRSRWCIHTTLSPKESGWIYLTIGRIRGWFCPDCGEKRMAAKNAKAALYGKILIAFREAKKYGFTWYNCEAAAESAKAKVFPDVDIEAERKAKVKTIPF